MPKKSFQKKKARAETTRRKTSKGLINDAEDGNWREARTEGEKGSRDMVMSGYHLK